MFGSLSRPGEPRPCYRLYPAAIASGEALPLAAHFWFNCQTATHCRPGQATCPP